jgi:hypothetical protein
MRIFKPLICASVLGLACSLPAQAHGPWTADHDRAQARHHAMQMDEGLGAMWDTGTSRDPMGLPTHGAWGTGSMMTEHAMAQTGAEGGYRREPVIAPQPGYAPRDRRWSDDGSIRGY